jgi:GntR family transcriptional regulator/MocR family aminotransferase
VGRALEAALREAIRSGRLHSGARLPGSRSLAADLGISRGTVVQAYTQLIAEGWLTGTTGSGTRVADLPGAGPVAGPSEDFSPAAARLAVDLRPGRPDLSSFPRTVWATSVRRADPRVRHSPAARVVPGARGAGGSGTGNSAVSGLSCWTGRCLVWQA